MKHTVGTTGGTTLRLIRDVPTRWSSTHLMISRALQLQRVCFNFILITLSK